MIAPKKTKPATMFYKCDNCGQAVSLAPWRMIDYECDCRKDLT
jgi:DNA-directed RNA polymerase subunit RPC12/RpoP